MDNYIQVYPNKENGEIELTGGYVNVHNTHVGDERSKNIKTGIFLAKKGYQVELLEVINQPNHKNPDARIIKEEDGLDIIIEFKHNEKATKNAIENEIRKAKKQADYILIDVSEHISVKELIEGIKSKYRRKEIEYRTMKDLWLLWKGELYILTREEILSGAIDNKIQ
jgi:hypothetical protein